MNFLVLDGDGIGPENAAATLQVVDAQLANPAGRTDAYGAAIAKRITG